MNFLTTDFKVATSLVVCMHQSFVEFVSKENPTESVSVIVNDLPVFLYHRRKNFKKYSKLCLMCNSWNFFCSWKSDAGKLACFICDIMLLDYININAFHYIHSACHRVIVWVASHWNVIEWPHTLYLWHFLSKDLRGRYMSSLRNSAIQFNQFITNSWRSQHCQIRKE